MQDTCFEAEEKSGGGNIKEISQKITNWTYSSDDSDSGSKPEDEGSKPSTNSKKTKKTPNKKTVKSVEEEVKNKSD